MKGKAMVELQKVTDKWMKEEGWSNL